MSILAALVDSLVDIGASLTNLLVVRYSLQPADDNHSFGHGKAESSRRWRKVCLSPVRHYSCFDGYSTSGISNTDDRSGRRGYRDNCGANLYDYPCLVSALGGAPDAKPAVRADMLHYQSDVMMNGAILLALGLSRYGWHRADALFALGIGIYILYSALRMGYEAVQSLLDRALPDEERQEIIDIVTSAGC